MYDMDGQGSPTSGTQLSHCHGGCRRRSPHLLYMCFACRLVPTSTTSQTAALVVEVPNSRPVITACCAIFMGNDYINKNKAKQTAAVVG